MLLISGRLAQTGWGVYMLQSQNDGKIIFIWATKLATIVSLKDVLTNPAFDIEEKYFFSVVGTYETQKEALNAMGNYMTKHGMPDLNKTIRWNRYTKVICHQTGVTYANQTECAKKLGLNQSQLSQHLRRAKGFRSIKGLSFSNIADESAVKPVSYEAVKPNPQAVQPNNA